MVAIVLRCIGREHTLTEERAGGVVCGGGHHTLEGGGAGLGRVFEAGVPLRGKATRHAGAGGQPRTPTSAKEPLGSIGTNWG